MNNYTKNPLGSSNPARAKIGRGPKGTTCGVCEYRRNEQGKYGPRSKCLAKSGQEYVYRWWASCAAYSGPSGQVEVVCPECRKPRMVTVATIKTSKSNGVCDSCSRKINQAKETVIRVEARKKPKPELPVHEGCSPVRAREGEPRPKCLNGGPVGYCESYSGCLNFSISRNWSGFKEGFGSLGKRRRIGH